MGFKEEPSQFSLGQTAQSFTCSIMEKPHTGLDECLKILLFCFRGRTSGSRREVGSHDEAGRKQSNSKQSINRPDINGAGVWAMGRARKEGSETVSVMCRGSNMKRSEEPLN